MAEKVRVFFVIDFERLIPQIKFVCSGIIGKKNEENHWWKATDIKEDVKKKMEKVTKKEIIPERIFVPFFWCWLGEGKKGDFKKESSYYSKVRNTLKEWMNYERKRERRKEGKKEGKSTYHKMTCFHITERFLARCFTQSEKYIGREKDGILEKGNICVFDYHQLEDARYGIDKVSLEVLDEDLGQLGKNFPLRPGLDREKVERCIESYTTMPSSEIIEKSGDIEDRFIKYWERASLTCLKRVFRDHGIGTEGQIQGIKSRLESLSSRITEGKYRIEEFDLNNIAEYSFFQDFSKTLKKWWENHKSELEGARFEAVIKPLKDEIELDLLKKLAEDDTLRNYLEDLTAYIHPGVRWKQLCIKMQQLKDFSVFGRFSLDKIFVEPRCGEKGKLAFSFLDEVLEKKKILIIMNEFGMGKSSLLREYASLLADRYLESISGKMRLPVFIRLADFFTSGDNEKQLLKSYIQKAYNFEPEKDFLLNRSFCLLADGFDEAEIYSESEIEANFKRLKNLSKYGDSRVIMTTRPGIFAHLSPAQREKLLEDPRSVCTRIEALSEEEIEAWLDKWHKRLGQEKISYSNLQSRGLEQPAKNPLFLYMIANVYKELEEEKEYTRTYMYSRFVDKTIRGKFEEDQEGKYHPKFSFATPDEYRKILREIAYHVFVRDRGIGFQEVSRVLKEEFNKRSERREAARSAIVCHFFTEMETGIYDFAHRTFMEYLNAERVLHVLLGVVNAEYDKDNQDSLEARFALCDRLLTQPIFDFLKELINIADLSEMNKKRLCALLQNWYTCDDLLLVRDGERYSSNQKHMCLPNTDRSLNIRILSLVLFIHVSSSLPATNRRIETGKFSFAGFLRRCQAGGQIESTIPVLLSNNLSLAHLERADLDRAGLTEADLRGAHLEEAELQETNLSDVKRWSDVVDFKLADITNVQGLSKEQIKYAVERGATCRGNKHN